jgi:hypothetical protein
MAVIGDLVTRLGVDGRKFQSGLDKARGDARSFASDITKIVSGIAIYDIGKSAVMSVFGLGKSTVELAATAETAAVQFKVLTGSAEEAASVMKQINKFAADTPFESMEITQAAKQLIAFGGSSKTVISELQTLGDLAAGMGIPLGELAELYGKSRIQGRLFMDDINQLQGRGINVTAELAKEFGNVREAVEKGQVNFSHLEKALKAMTTEGGAFAGMMVDMSATFDGKLSTMIDNVKTLGRGIGEMLLPPLKNVLSDVNNILGKFNEMPNRVEFIGDVIESSFDVAFLHIAEKWDEMLIDMAGSARDLLISGAGEMLMPAWMGDLGGAMEVGKRNENRPQDLEAANKRLEELLGKLQGPAAAAAPAAQAKPRFEGNTPAINNLNAVYAEWDRLGAEANKARDAFLAAAPGPDQIAAMKVSEDAQAALSKMAQVTVKEAHAEVRKETGGRKLTEGVSSLWKALESPIAEAQMAAQGMWDRGKIKADAAMGTLSNIFTGDPAKKEKPIEPRLAGAMQAGSQDAYSTIVQAMIRQADPVVKAVREQTKEQKKSWNLITQTIKEARPRYLAEFGGM